MKTRLPAFRGIVAALIVTGSLTDSPSMAQESPEEPPPDEQQAGEDESAAETKGAIGKVRGRILPAPFVITEPAIGKGLGLGFIYFHGRDAVERPRVQSASAVGPIYASVKKLPSPVAWPRKGRINTKPNVAAKPVLSRRRSRGWLSGPPSWATMIPIACSKM